MRGRISSGQFRPLHVHDQLIGSGDEESLALGGCCRTRLRRFLRVLEAVGFAKGCGEALSVAGRIGDGD